MFRSVATPLPNPLPKGEGIKTLLADGLSTQRRVRTASDSDRIIFHLSFSIYHWPFGGFICHRTMSNNEQMKNAKWKMTNDPVATARGSDTYQKMKIAPIALLLLLSVAQSVTMAQRRKTVVELIVSG